MSEREFADRIILLTCRRARLLHVCLSLVIKLCMYMLLLLNSFTHSSPTNVLVYTTPMLKRVEVLEMSKGKYMSRVVYSVSYNVMKRVNFNNEGNR